MKKTTRGKAGKGAAASPSRIRLSPDAWRLIRDEARSLGVTRDEYVRLTGKLFQTLRKAMADNQDLDGKGLLQLVENPLFGMVIQYLAANVSKSPQTEKSDSGQPQPLLNQPPQQAQPVQPFGQPQSPAQPYFRDPRGPRDPSSPNIPPEWQIW